MAAPLEGGELLHVGDVTHLVEGAILRGFVGETGVDMAAPGETRAVDVCAREDMALLITAQARL